MPELHPQMQAILTLLSAKPQPPLDSLTPATARALDAEHFDAFWNADAPDLASVTDHTLPGAEGRIRLRLYDPGVPKPAPSLVYLHGGGWVLGGLGSHDRICRELALAGTVLVASIDYRLAPEHKFPRPLLDCIAATRWIASQGRSLGIDERQIAIGGDSAGGNLALATLLAFRDTEPQVLRAGVLVYGMFAADPHSQSQRQFGDGRYLLSTADTEWFWRCYLNGEAERNDRRAVPLKDDLHGLPPLYIAAAELDPLLDDSLRLVERLKEATQPHEFRLWPGLTHASLHMTRMLEPMRGYIEEIGLFLKGVLARKLP